MQQAQYLSLPSKPGVYQFRDKAGKIIYIGKAKDLKKRVSSYFRKNTRHDPKTENLLSNINSVDYILVASEIEAFLLEANLIKKYRPFYNIQLADDKFFPYIKIANVFYKKLRINIPYITITRKKDDGKAQYFGPYPNAAAVKTVLKLLRRIFPFQSVKNHPVRKCLFFHINLCPCIPFYPGNITYYKKNVARIKRFLEGNKGKIIDNLEKERENFAKTEEFEKASSVQDKIDRINLITSPFFDPFSYEKDPGLYIKRVKEELNSLMKFLSAYFRKIKDLNRIECYDISNIQGKNATGSMVVFINAQENKNHYRRFKIKSKTTPDDYKTMQEIITRRLKHKEWEYPDLIVIDGGRGQVGAVLDILTKQKIEIPIIGLAKREETIVIPQYQNENLVFNEEKLPLSNPGLNILRRIRDEAHRFAISYHKLLRKKQFLNLTA